MNKKKEKKLINKAKKELKNLGIDVSSYSDEEIKELVIKTGNIIINRLKIFREDFREFLDKALQPFIKTIQPLIDLENKRKAKKTGDKNQNLM
jgi:hypothetical protein